MEEELVSENFSAYLVIPSLLTILIALIILFSKRWRKLLLENVFIFGFLTSLLGMNLIEVITYGNLSKNFDFLLRTYYCFVTLMLSSFLCLTEKLNSHSSKFRKSFYFYVGSSSLFFIIIIYFTNLFVAGAFPTGLTILRIPGNYYWMFLSYLFLCILAGLVFIFFGITKATNPLDKKRHTVIFFSLLPLALTLTIVFLLIQFGSIINLSFFLPICTLIFLIVYLYTENRRNLFKFLVNIPFSEERAAYKELNDRVIEYMSKTQIDEKISLKEAMSELEKAFINRALKMKGGNHNLAAELLSISMSTIYRKEDRKDDP